MGQQDQAIPMTRRRTGSSVQYTREIQPAQTDGAERTPRKWYLLIGRGMYRDVRNRLPYYRSDWTDAWNYRVVPATFVSSSFFLRISLPIVLISLLPDDLLCQCEAQDPIKTAYLDRSY